MRDLFDGIFPDEPLDPIAAARRAMRTQLRRRFYQRAEVENAKDEFRVLLDGRPVKTPARRTLAAPSRTLAQQLAAEWEAQRDVIDPAKMPLTRLANSIIDGVIDAPSMVALEVERYLACDLVFYRAGGPAGLVMRQAKVWDPVLAWVREAIGAPRPVLARRGGSGNGPQAPDPRSHVRFGLPGRGRSGVLRGHRPGTPLVPPRVAARLRPECRTSAAPGIRVLVTFIAKKSIVSNSN